MTYIIEQSFRSFGDSLMLAMVVEILNDNNVDAALAPTTINHLVTCRKIKDYDVWGGHIKLIRKNRTGLDTDEDFNVYTDLIKEFKKAFDIKKDIKITRDHIPVLYYDLPLVKDKKYDIAMVTQTGPFTSYRAWPYFNELKELLKKNKISFIDLSELGVRDIEFLNYVKHSKLYLGLETGPSHYASQAANGKAIIIQSGYCNFHYWAGAYKYQFIESRCERAPCWLREGCTYEHKCLRDIKPKIVLEVIKHKL